MNVKQVINNIEKYRERKQKNYLNCIPAPFERLSYSYPGVEPGKYYLVTANAKVGKSQISDYMFVLHPVDYILNNSSNYDIEVLYFSLEMSRNSKMLQFISHFLFTKYNIKIDTKGLRSLKEELPEVILNRVKELEPYLEKVFSKIHIYDQYRTRKEIVNKIFQYAEKNGEIVRNTDGNIVNYIPKNPEKITIIFVDHISLLMSDNLLKEINQFSANDMIFFRNIFNFTPVIIQQQASSQESVENKKFDALMPSLSGLADNKTTQRDADYVFGLFSPHRHHIKNLHGYDIEKFKDRFRSLEILANREGNVEGICPLYFQGESIYFEELPKPSDTKSLSSVYIRHNL